MENLMTNNSTNKIDNERLRIWFAFLLSIIGLALAAFLAGFLVVKGETKVATSNEVATIVGLFTSVTGTLVGAFFGLQIGAAGAELERRSRLKAEERHRNAEELVQSALARLNPDTAKEVIEAHRARVGDSGSTA
jgi:hypothetical protein